MADGKTKVMIVDDSAVIRHLLTEILSRTDDLEVAGTAQDPVFALGKIKKIKPDVITLDVEMPRMDGLTFLEELMRTDPIPVVMVSALTQKGCETTLRALEMGAVDFVEKPVIDISKGVIELGEEIVGKVRAAARARLRTGRRGAGTQPTGRTSPGSPPFALDPRRMSTTDRIIAIGASTGGTEAITEVVSALPESTPGIVIVQHMPPVFTRSFAERLNSLSRMDVKEARAGDRVLRGAVLIAPGNRHMTIRRNGAMYYADLSDGPMVHFVRPSADVLFHSVARCAGKNAIGVILTGMGEDGAKGLRKMKEEGAFTIAQNEATSVVFGMPRKAIEMQAADRVLALEAIAAEVLRACG
ncbi:MAG TPA: chemotaxis response regulator protein-glutamate methylesterase [Dissulfurispiraceae bacterium]